MQPIFRAQHKHMLHIFRAKQTAYVEQKSMIFAIFFKHTYLRTKICFFMVQNFVGEPGFFHGLTKALPTALVFT